MPGYGRAIRKRVLSAVEAKLDELTKIAYDNGARLLVVETELRNLKEETKQRRGFAASVFVQLLPHLIGALLWIGALYYQSSSDAKPIEAAKIEKAK